MISTNETSEQAAPDGQQPPAESVSAPSLMAAALALAKQGFFVFPCGPRSKIPLEGSHGHRDASTDAGRITAWWDNNSQANVAVACAPSGVTVLDLDSRNGGPKTLAHLEEALGPLPETVEAATGGGDGGRHLFFKNPGVPLVGKLAGGIDVKSSGHVVVAPSVHPSGGVYRWTRSPFEYELAELPARWIERLAKPGPTKTPSMQREKSETTGTTSAYGAAAMEAEIRTVRSATEGSRNDTLNRAGFALGQLNAGGEVVDVREELVQAAMEVGLPEYEARRTVDSGWVAGVAEPRRAPNAAHGESGDSELSDATTESAWELPIGLETGSLPGFPIEALPVPLGEYAAAVATAVQVPVDMPGVLTLGALSAACGNWLAVQVTEGYIEPVNLYLVVAMDPGNRKSAAVARMTAPIEGYERQLREERKVAVAAERAEYDAFVKRLEETKRNAAKAEAEEQAATLAAVREAAADLENRRMPVLPRLLADDITSEKQVSLLVEHGSMAMLSPEGGVFDIIGGRYSGGEPNLDVYLKAHTGEPITVDRMNRPSEHVARPILTLCLTVQLVVLRRLAEKRDFRGRGLVARFLYSIPPSLLGRRAVNPPPVPPDLSHRYEQLLRTLLSSAGGPIAEPRMLRLSGEAHAAWLAFCGEHEPRLGEGGDFASVTDWAGKLPGAIIRIAGLLHAAQFPGAPTDTPISAATMTSAIALGKYFTSHALAAFALMGADPTLDGARHILTWLKRVDPSSFVLRDAFQALKGTFKKVDELRAALAILEERSYIRQRPEGRREGPGRRPSPTYDVNPLWLQAATCSHNPQNSQNSEPIIPPTNSEDCGNSGNGSGSGLEDSVAPVAALTEANSGNCEDSGNGFQFAEDAEPAAGEEPAELAGGQSGTSNDTEEGFL